MSEKNHKKMRRYHVEDDNVFLSCCDDCGGFSEIKEEDKSGLLRALNNGCLVMVSRKDLKKFNRGE